MLLVLDVSRPEDGCIFVPGVFNLRRPEIARREQVMLELMAETERLGLYK